jgi:hypothetical protein
MLDSRESGDPEIREMYKYITELMNQSLGYRKEDQMLWTVAVILVILWLLGFVSSYTMGGFIHILLVVAVIVVLVRVIQGRRIV